MRVNIKIINQLTDNYSYVIYSKETKEALVESEKVQGFINGFLEQDVKPELSLVQ